MPVGQPKTGGSWWRGLTECGPLEKGMANHFSILALRTHEQYEQYEKCGKSCLQIVWGIWLPQSKSSISTSKELQNKFQMDELKYERAKFPNS